jgi:hypothetical protein
MIHGIAEQFSEPNKPDVRKLTRMRESMHRSVYSTEPQPVAVYDEAETLEALFKAYLAPRGAPRNPTTKGMDGHGRRRTHTACGVVCRR